MQNERQISLEELEREIEAELRMPTWYGNSVQDLQKEKPEPVAARPAPPPKTQAAKNGVNLPPETENAPSAIKYTQNAAPPVTTQNNAFKTQTAKIPLQLTPAPPDLKVAPPDLKEAALKSLEEEAQTVSRKPYRINDFDSPRDKEMAVFTHAKKLSEYIFVITEKSPKKLRWSIIVRLQNISVQIVEQLYHANFERDDAERIAYQKKAAVSLKILDFYTEVARKKQAVTIRQTEIIARQIAETTKLLGGWVKSTKRK